MSSDDEQKEIVLTENEAKVYSDIQVCKSACKKIIAEVVKHFEDNEVAEREFWFLLEEKYDLDLAKNDYNAQFKGKNKLAISCVGSIDDRPIREVKEKINKTNAIRSEVKKRMGIEK